MKVKVKSEKPGLNLNIEKTKNMASVPITSYQIDEEKNWKQWQTLFFLGSKITSGGGCRLEIKRHLLLARKVMTNLDSILKSTEIDLSTKVHLVKAMIFPVVMYGWESWTINKAESWCFWAVVLEKTLEIPLRCKDIKPVNPKGNQS